MNAANENKRQKELEENILDEKIILLIVPNFILKSDLTITTALLYLYLLCTMIYDERVTHKSLQSSDANEGNVSYSS